MLVVLLLKIVYKYKAKGTEELELCLIKKTTSLEFSTEYGEWYIIPTISISFNCGVDIALKWFKIYYSSYWQVITYKDEDEYAEFINNKNNNK